MRTILFGILTFTVSDDGILSLVRCGGCDASHRTDVLSDLSVCEFDIAGGTSTGINRMHGAEATKNLRYVEHTIENGVLTILQRSDIAEITSVFTSYGDTGAVRVVQTIKNITDEMMCLEMANTIGIRFGGDVVLDSRAYYFHKFNNARYTEAMPEVRSLYDYGFGWENAMLHVENIGNASSREYLPQGILENRRDGGFLMFQIESYADWFYEITYSANQFHLQIGGPTARRHAWNKELLPGAAYTTVPVALAWGDSLNNVLADMTRYRRHIKPDCISDRHLPAIYNEYMHLSWDDPFAARVREIAPAVAKSGCEYYVIDCGWHDSASVNTTEGMYRLFGTWYEERGRFPEGIRETAEYVRSLGMKFGLWIAPEVVGHENHKMLAYYDDDCFFKRNGKKISHWSGYLLDYRHPKVYDYMTATIDRMVNEYGCDYIKFDGCPNAGFGTELDASSPGDGLEQAMDAFLAWTQDMMDRHPNVIFEDCAGGGQRMDYKALSMFSLISTSDQTSYLYYPYITANISASVLPEQAAVWSYPVATDVYDAENESGVDDLVSEERVVLNMINAIPGRIHLASRIHLLSETKQALIREGVDVYNALTPEKLRAVPYLPKGYAGFGDTFAATGLRTEDKVYLAVWNLGGDRHVTLPLPEITVKNASVLYPKSLPTEYAFDASSLTIDFTADAQARLFVLDI